MLTSLVSSMLCSLSSIIESFQVLAWFERVDFRILEDLTGEAER